MSACGTNAGYVAHRRAGQQPCRPCTDAHADYQRLYKSTSAQCKTCHTEIEACDGVFGEWMHTSTRQERADDGHLAQPFTLPREAAS